MEIITDQEVSEIIEKGQSFNEELSYIFKKYSEKFDDLNTFFKMLCHGMPVFMAQVADFIIEDRMFEQKLDLIDCFKDNAKNILLKINNDINYRKLDS